MWDVGFEMRRKRKTGVVQFASCIEVGLRDVIQVLDVELVPAPHRACNPNQTNT